VSPHTITARDLPPAAGRPVDRFESVGALPPELLLRLPQSIDPDTLAAQLAALWRVATGRCPPAVRVEMSVVETCGRTRGERERDARRLLQAERGPRPRPGSLRATLVSVDAHEHLLLLAAASGTGALTTLVTELERLHPLLAVVSG
jgi:hypothetical protein